VNYSYSTRYKENIHFCVPKFNKQLLLNSPISTATQICWQLNINIYNWKKIYIYLFVISEKIVISSFCEIISVVLHPTRSIFLSPRTGNLAGCDRVTASRKTLAAQNTRFRKRDKYKINCYPDIWTSRLRIAASV